MNSGGYTLRWERDGGLPDHLRAVLAGPGAPFERHLADVLGQQLEVFARRPSHLRQVLETAAATHGDKAYLVFPDETLSFTQVRDRAAGLAGRLAGDFGIGAGDRVAIAAANSLDYALAYWATVSLGAIMVGLNGWWAPAELAYGITLTDPKLVLVDERRQAALGATDALVSTLAELSSGAPVGAFPDVSISEDDPAVVLFTSGTTGRPKGAALSHRNIIHFGLVPALAAAVQFMSELQAGGEVSPPPPAVSICGAPLFHVSGTTPLLMTGGMHGATLVFPPATRWSEVTHLELTEAYRVTSWSVVPTQLWRILQHPELARHDVSSVRTVGAGGSDFAPELRRLVAERLPGVRITNGFGMTETAGCAALGQHADGERHPTAVGAAAPTMEIQIRDEAGVPLAEGAIGEIAVRGATVFLGYWEDLEATGQALDAERWYRTGDMGRIEDGLLFLHSRLSDRIIRGGENVSPVEIENRLLEHPEIDDAAVVGIAHQVLGQEIKAVIVRHPGSALNAGAVRDWVRGGLAAFKVPSIVEFRDELPRTETGKVLKFQLVADG